MKEALNKDVSSISALNFFSQFSRDDLNKLLDCAVVTRFKKSQSVFLAEEKVHNFYVVLSGAVQLSVLDEEGCETTIQISEAGSFLNDIFGEYFQTDARALCDSQIVVFQIKKIRDLLHKIPQFGFAVLQETAARNRSLLKQISQMRLNNSQQKVGQFLLGMAFEKGGNKNEMLELRYEKSMIASYLGIKSETLSRALQKLKNDGEIKVEKSKIILLRKESLCRYCDKEIASKCSSHKEDFCTQK